MSEKKKSGCFGKCLKLLLWGLVGLVVLVLVMVAAMPLWISPVATGVANGVVPQITGTAFHIDRFYVNPWTGAVRINNVKLSNPEGFGQAPAVSVTSVSVDIALMELFSDKLHIKDVTIVDPFASYYSHDGKNNIDVILANVEKSLGTKKEKEAEKPEEEKAKSEMKIIIDHLKVSGTKVKLMESDMIPPLPIMTIELNDIGKESGGATFEEAWKAISDAFIKGMSSVGDGLGALGGLLGDGAKGLTSALGEGTKSVTDALGSGTKSVTEALGSGTKSVTEALGSGTKSVNEAIGSGTKSVTEALGGAASSTGDGAKSAASTAVDATKSAASGAADMTKSAASAVGDGAKATVDAVGDTAKKATEGVKNLFKGFGK